MRTDWMASVAGWFRPYGHPRVAAMLFLGFSAGLPFLLVFNTLSAWLREAGIDRGTIGLMSWVGITYSIKFFWAPIVDRLPLPGLTRWLGRRRGWMLLAQVTLAVGLYCLALQQPGENLSAVVWFALLVAFAAATQDIVVDAWRIEAAPLSMQGSMAAAYQLGYRAAIIVTSAGALWLAGEYGWKLSYTVMATLVGVGLLTTLLIPEPDSHISRDTLMREARVVRYLEARAHWPEWARTAGAWFIGSVVCPFVDFFERNGLRMGLMILAFVGLFRLTDITMGVMANAFYLDVGYTLQQIAEVAKGYGIIASIIGVLVGGAAVARMGLTRTLVFGAVLVMLSNLSFSVLALQSEPSLLGLGLVVSADNFAYNFAGTAFIAYLSGLTNTAYTATQYALFSSLFTLPGKLLAGGSGFVVDAAGYPFFFLYTSLLGIPALLILLWLRRRLPVPAPA
ncbi:MAG: AmpG family muropeptide MFS transporter [Gammaproteobacteria bacterium]